MAQEIGKISLKNSGGFVCRIQLKFQDDDLNNHYTKETGDITLGFTKEIDPEELGVPDGTSIWLKAIVRLGRDNESNKGFKYVKGNTNVARFNISGTTLSNDLGFVGIG